MKIENMKLQHDNLQIFSEKDEAKLFQNKNINKTASGYIILADSENIKDEFLKEGADVVILGGQSKNPSVQEILSAIDKIDKKTIYIFPNNKNVITTAKLAAEKSDKNIIVYGTKTMLEGHYCLKNRAEDIEELKNTEKRNYSIEITKAVRDTRVEDLTITKDDFIALVNGKIKLTEEEISGYIDEANDILKNAYVPYSKFPVAALLIDEQGRKFRGVNVENASYGLGICAERNVIPTAVTEGMKKIKLLVVTGGTPEPISPCGACRQVISEFSDKDTVIILTNRDKKYKISMAKTLAMAR